MRLGNKASKAASRVAAEGVVGVFIAPDGKLGAIVEVNCETDFVAKNEDFLAFARRLAELVASAEPGRRRGARRRCRSEARPWKQTRTALVGRIGENMSIRRFARIEAKGG